MAEELEVSLIRGECPDNRTCPAVRRTNRGSLMITGRLVTDPAEMAKLKIGPGEVAVEVPQSLMPEVS